MSRSNNRQRIELTSRFDEVAKAQNAILAAAEAHGFDQLQQFAIKLAVEEAITNAIKHGNCLDPAKKVTVDYQIDDEQLRVVVCDQGPGFHPDHVPDPTLDENLERPCGRGLMLMRAYMTEVSYSDSGNCVTMIKRRSCRLPDQLNPNMPDRHGAQP